jgi:hypothetical protein
MQKPPPLPAEVLARALRISGIDGFTLVFIAGGFGLVSFACSDWVGALVGGLAAGAGLVELRGRQKLRAGDVRGVNWLVRSQLVLLATILLYLAYQLHSFDPQPVLAKIEPVVVQLLRALGFEVTSLGSLYGLTETEFLAFARTATCVAYVAVGLASILCQGGLAVYYQRREQVVAKALRKI